MKGAREAKPQLTAVLVQNARVGKGFTILQKRLNGDLDCRRQLPNGVRTVIRQAGKAWEFGRSSYVLLIFYAPCDTEAVVLHDSLVS